MCRRHHPNVDGDGSRRSDGTHFFVLQRAQQLGLNHGGNFADLVEEDGSALGHPKQAVRPGGTRERAFAMAEELTLDNRFRERSAIDRNERTVASRTGFVHGARDEFFARTALPLDEDVALVLTEARDPSNQRLDRGGTAPRASRSRECSGGSRRWQKSRTRGRVGCEVIASHIGDGNRSLEVCPGDRLCCDPHDRCLRFWAAPLREPEASLPKTQILVADDEELYRNALERVLRRAGHEVVLARDGDEAIARASEGAIDLVLCDIQMPGRSGARSGRIPPSFEPPTSLVSSSRATGARRSPWTLSEWARSGISKNPSTVRTSTSSAAWSTKPSNTGDSARKIATCTASFGPDTLSETVVGASAAFRRVLDTVAKVAETDSTILVTGESGTGKELVARAIHYNSARCDRMLGHRQTAGRSPKSFSSPSYSVTPKVLSRTRSSSEPVASPSPTVEPSFLDEIGDMSPNLQVKLLRVLQERTFEPVGSSKTVSVDVRVIAATHQDLEAAIEQKTFREDLYYRLNVIPIEVPPLRQRREDIPLLIQHFLDKVQEETGRTLKGFSEEALGALVGHQWPGNVRELENMIERLTVLREGYQVEVGDLPASLLTPSRTPGHRPAAFPEEGVAFQELVSEYETDLIRQALERTQWNKNRAAKLLGLNRTTLIEKIKRRQIEAPS